MDTYNNLVLLINNGKKTREHILNCMDIFLMNETITSIQYTKLNILLEEVRGNV